MSSELQAVESPRQTRRAAILWTVIVGVLATLVAAFSFRGQALVTAPPEASAPVTPPQGPVYTMVLPHDPPELPPGSHRDQVAVSCTICHSTRLVLNQPAFPQEKWTEVVHKMVAVYGAPIPPEEEPQLVEYLTSVRGR
ncbi:MAG TPA: hypothetical protein VMG10_31595 [Gemmataceae bacterium]|nr:hypothetical protein [Gemmataceae bacterium]